MFYNGLNMFYNKTKFTVEQLWKTLEHIHKFYSTILVNVEPKTSLKLRILVERLFKVTVHYFRKIGGCLDIKNYINKYLTRL